MSTFSKSQHTNSSRAEEQDVTSQKSFPVPRSGRGRGARFKYLQSQPNLDICITREIENAVGTAHRMSPSNAFSKELRMSPSNARHTLGMTNQMAPSAARHPSVPPEDEVKLIRGTSRGWIPMEFREAARNKHPTILKDLAAHEEVTPWGTRDGRNDNKSLVQSSCGRYWTVDKRNTLADFIPQVPKVKDTQSDTGILTQVSHDIPEVPKVKTTGILAQVSHNITVVPKVKDTGTLTQVSHDKETDGKRDTTCSEMGDSVYSTVPSTVCSRDTSFHSLLTAEGDGEDEVEKYHI